MFKKIKDRIIGKDFEKISEETWAALDSGDTTVFGGESGGVPNGMHIITTEPKRVEKYLNALKKTRKIEFHKIRNEEEHDVWEYFIE